MEGGAREGEEGPAGFAASGLGAQEPVGGLSTGRVEAGFAALDIEVEDQQLAHVVRTGMLGPAGRGTITIDTGAAESKGMLPKEPAVEGVAKESGMKSAAANGASMDNVGEKKAKFATDGVPGISGITLQLTDASKPLASVTAFGTREIT